MHLPPPVSKEHLLPVETLRILFLLIELLWSVVTKLYEHESLSVFMYFMAYF